jgi:hypothetical protein
VASDVRRLALAALSEMDAVPGSIEVVREKQVDDHLVVAARFRDGSERDRRGCVGLRRTEGGGWHRAGGGWSSNARDAVAEGIWLNSGGWGPADPSGEFAVLGGWVSEPSAISIRVTDPNGRVEEDRIEAGVALLMWHGNFNHTHATAELLDSSGQVLLRGPAVRTR